MHDLHSDSMVIQVTIVPNESHHRQLLTSVSFSLVLLMQPAIHCTSRKIIFYDNFVLFWTHHSKHLRQLGCVIPSIHITMDHFLVILDISCHFGRCYKRPCFLLVLAYTSVEVSIEGSNTSFILFITPMV